MTTPVPSQWLDVWERALPQPPLRRALTLLSLEAPASTPDALAQLSLGQRDARLFALRKAMFGTQLESVVHCTGCGQPLEMSLNVDDLCAAPPPPPASTFTTSVDDLTLVFRLPGSDDLAAAAQCASDEAARELVLSRCVISAQQGKRALAADQLSPAAQAALTAAMANADPQAVVELQLTCAHCAAQWSTLFDIAGYLWTELHAWSQRLLREVHVLASTYGWSEHDIVAMRPARRRLYLEMIGA